MNLNDYIPTSEAAKDLCITRGYFAVIAKQRNWQNIKISKTKLWLKADVRSFLAESATLLERTYHTNEICRLLGVSSSRIRAIAKNHRISQVQWSRWLKDDWKPILEKRGIIDEAK